MKKIIALALSVVFMFSLCSCGNNGQGIPFEECKQIAVGTWIDPLNRASSLLINQDGTAIFLDETYTWDVTWSDKDAEDTRLDWRTDSFFLNLYDNDGNEIYEFLFWYKYVNGLWNVSHTYTRSEDLPEYEFADYALYKEGSIETIIVNDYNFDEYFELNQILEWKDEEKTEWNCLAYICLKPELEERSIKTNWRSKFYCDVQWRYYYVEVDAENDTLELLELKNPEDGYFTNSEELELFMDKNSHNYSNGYLTLDYVFMYNSDDDNGEYLQVAETYDVSGTSYTLILKK